MSKENYRQAILTKQGRKAFKGDVSGHTDAEVRRKGLGRIVRRGGTLATVGTGVALIVSNSIGEQNKVNAAQVRQDKRVAGKLFNSDLGPSFSGAVGAPATTGSVAPESTSATSSDSESLDSDGGTTMPAATPSEGAWTPTPGAVSVSSTEVTSGGQASETGGLPAEPAPPEAGGVSPK